MARALSADLHVHTSVVVLDLRYDPLVGGVTRPFLSEDAEDVPAVPSLPDEGEEWRGRMSDLTATLLLTAPASRQGGSGG